MDNSVTREEQNALLAAVIEANLDCVVVIDEDGLVVEWNPASQEAFGHMREEAIGREISDLIIPPRHRPAHAHGFARYLAGGAPSVLGRRVELEALRNDGNEFPVELTITEVRTAGRRLFTASLRDLSERAHAERELSQSRGDLAAFLHYAPVGILIKENDGRYAYANRSVAELYGHEQAEIVGALPSEILDDGIMEEIAAIDEAILASGHEYLGEIAYRTRAGREFVALTARFPLFNQAREVNRVGIVMLDVSSLRKAELELKDSKERLQQAEKISALGSLLAGVSHELNNPLSVVLGETYLLIEDAENTPFAARAESIRQAAERCGRIVQTFLAMARRKQPALVPEDINGIVSEAVAMTDYARASAGIALETRFANDLPTILGDRSLLHQVIVNLIVNAQQAIIGGEGNKVLLSTALEGDWIVVRVADNGPGIPAEIAARIFEPFYTTKSEGSGTGIGLSFSQGVIDTHGGTLTLEPSEQGALFAIHLPVRGHAGG